MARFRCNMTENFIFLLKYRQRKVDLNTSKKSLVFVTMRHLYVQLSYTKISYLRKNTHLRKDAAFLHFRLKESSENMIFPWNGNIRKETKIWSFLHFSQIFVRRKFFFSCSESYLVFSNSVILDRHILNISKIKFPKLIIHLRLSYQLTDVL